MILGGLLSALYRISLVRTAMLVRGEILATKHDVKRVDGLGRPDCETTILEVMLDFPLVLVTVNPRTKVKENCLDEYEFVVCFCSLVCFVSSRDAFVLPARMCVVLLVFQQQRVAFSCQSSLFVSHVFDVLCVCEAVSPALQARK